MMYILTYFSKTHTWLLPVFAVGLGAPRWCQMMWGTSSLALYIPWAGNSGPYLGISLWLWLGVLDAVQGVGLGMILLQVGLDFLAVLNCLLTSRSDLVSIARLRNARLLADHWIGLRNGRACNSTQRHRPRKRLPRRGEEGRADGAACACGRREGRDGEGVRVSTGAK